MREVDLKKTLPPLPWKQPREDDADLFGADAPDAILDNETAPTPTTCAGCGTSLAAGSVHGGGLCAICSRHSLR